MKAGVESRLLKVTPMPRALLLLAFSILLCFDDADANPVQDENRLPGTSAWSLRDLSRSGEIEGFASATSVNRGEAIELYVSAIDPTYTIEIFRMGWYEGAGGRRMTDLVRRAGRQQTIPAPDPVTGLIECQWSDPHLLTVPGDWLSGVFLAKLTGEPSGKQNYIMFVVREDERDSDILFQSAVTTSEAYNDWGGKSLYPFNSTGPHAAKVSFNRPYSAATGANEFLLRFEYQMVRFLEREGFDVSYATNIDMHTRGDLLRRHRAFLSVGHDEYWSAPMRQSVEVARDAGVDLGFFSGNVCYWQIRFEADAAGRPHRTIVAYKENALSSDPILTDGDPTNDNLATTRWRDVPVNRPEEQFIGVMTSITQVDGDIVVEKADHWVFRGSGLRTGDRLIGLAGYEVDKMFSAFPRGTIRLAHSPVTRRDGRSDFADMTIYEAASGALVFAAGTIQWSWGLDDFASGSRGPRASPAAQQITRNVLNAFIYGAPRAKRRSIRS